VEAADDDVAGDVSEGDWSLDHTLWNTRQGCAGAAAVAAARRAASRDVALQVAFERQTLKPVFSLDRL
jgi:hypothetical protein